MAGISSNALKGVNYPENRLKYNGKELQSKEFNDGAGLEWYDYGARMYDVQVGRWGSVDTHSDSYNSFSPYVYVGNNPFLLIDSDGRDWFYHSRDGGSEPEWIWHEGCSYDTGLKDQDGKEVVLQGTKAAVVFHGTRSERLGERNGKPGYINGDGAITASVTVYGPDGESDIHTFTGYTMSSGAEKFGAIDEGMYDGNYDVEGKSGNLKSHWAVENRGKIRTMDGALNPFLPNQVTQNGEGYKDGIFIHSSNASGFAGEYEPGKGISVGCLLIAPKDWKSFNTVMEGVKKYKVQVIRDVYSRSLIMGVNGDVPISIIKKTVKQD